MVLPFDAHMVRRVKVEHHQLLAEGNAGQELGQGVLGLGAAAVEEDGEGPVGEEGQGNGGVLEVVEVVGGDGAVDIKWLVLGGANEELHGYGEGASKHDEEELQVPHLGGGEPWGGGIGIGT